MRQLAGVFTIAGLVLTVVPGAWAGQTTNPAAKPPVPTTPKATAPKAAAATPKAAPGAKLPTSTHRI